jgi:hypothetical protein
MDEVAEQLHIPAATVLGGAETAYPEYQDKLGKGR